MSLITSIHGRQILDSRGNPTVEVEATLADGSWEKVVFPTRGKCPHRKHISTAQRATKEGPHQHTQQELFQIPPMSGSPQGWILKAL